MHVWLCERHSVGIVLSEFCEVPNIYAHAHTIQLVPCCTCCTMYLPVCIQSVYFCVSFFRKAVLKTQDVRYWMATVKFDGAVHIGRMWYEPLITHQLSMLQCRPLHWWRGNLKPPINSCRPVKLPSGLEWRTPYLSSGPRPNLFQREVMKKLIISNEELVIRARRNDCQCWGVQKVVQSAKQYSLGTQDFLDLLWAADRRV